MSHMAAHKGPVQMRDCIVIASLKYESTDRDEKPVALLLLRNLDAAERVDFPKSFHP